MTIKMQIPGYNPNVKNQSFGVGAENMHFFPKASQVILMHAIIWKPECSAENLLKVKRIERTWAWTPEEANYMNTT